MANAMNFRAAATPPPIFRKPKPKGPFTPGFPKQPARNLPVFPVEPENTGNDNEFKARMDIYRKNQKSYNAAKVGKKWKESYIKTGGGYVNTDFGEGERGAAIPWAIGERDQVRQTKKIAETDVEARARKAKEAADKAEAIKRRQKKKK